MDATLLFGRALLQEAKHIKSVLDKYSLPSGQKINAEKSKIYTFNIKSCLQKKIVNHLGFQTIELPCKYLGILFFIGENSISYWDKIIHSIQMRIASWKGRWLSLSGHILLIKSVLSAIPNYYMVVLKGPKLVILLIEKLIRDFLWKGNIDNKKKISLISLENLCEDKLKGGAGIHNLSTRNQALGAKLVWYMYAKPQEKWCKVMQVKYLDNANPKIIFIVSNPPQGSTMWNFLVACRKVITPYLGKFKMIYKKNPKNILGVGMHL